MSDGGFAFDYPSIGWDNSSFGFDSQFLSNIQITILTDTTFSVGFSSHVNGQCSMVVTDINSAQPSDATFDASTSRVTCYSDSAFQISYSQGSPGVQFKCWLQIKSGSVRTTSSISGVFNIVTLCALRTLSIFSKSIIDGLPINGELFKRSTGEVYAYKSPLSTVDYGWDWSDWLAFDVNDFIVSADLSFSGGISGNTFSVTSDSVGAWVSGGADGSVCSVTCRIITNNGRTDQRTILLYVYDQ